MGSQKKRPVVLTESDRDELVRLTRTGVHPASMIMRARVLLALDTSGGEVDAKEVLAARLGVSGETLRLVAKRFAETGGDAHATISRKQRELPPVVSVVTGEVEARLIALACSAPPPGYGRWSLRLLEKHVALVEDIPDLDHSTIGRVLKNGTASSSKEMLGDPAAGERGLRRGDGGRSRGLCPRLRPGQAGGVHGREALPTPGACPRPDPRHTGTRSQAGQRIRPARHLLDLLLGPTPRRVAAGGRPTPPDQDRLGRAGRTTPDRRLPRGREGRTGHGQPQHPHRRLALRSLRPSHRVRTGPTPGDPPHPKHGSWLNIAEIELSTLTRQCLDRRIADLDTLNTELAAWQHATNTAQRQVDWHFTTNDARTRLRHLYPKH